MAREYFCAYHSYLKSIEPLNDAERGRLFTACLEYSSTGVAPDLRGNERFVWPTIREQIDRDAAKYDAYCGKQRENIKKRWDTTVYDGKSGIPSDTKNTKEKEKTKAKEKTKTDLSIPDGIDCRADVQRVVAAWNSLGLSKVERLMPDTDRYKMLKCRLRDYGLEAVLKAIENVRTSDFLLGRVGNRPFVITFDWFVRPNNFPKVLDGNYNNGGGHDGHSSDTGGGKASCWDLAAVDL